jgi:alpha-tubulin suppressor-like RCC1 family protein
VLGSSTADREYTCQDGVAAPVGPKGNGIALGQADPVRAGWRQVSTAVPFACATRVEGTLYCWGSNGNGSTGLGLTSGETLVPTQVGTDSDWAQVGLGHVAACAVKTTGTLWCWGSNIYGLTGQGVQTGSTNVPTQVGTDSDWRSVHGGRYFVCATKSNNTVWCWGANDSGQTGLGAATGTQLVPTQVGTDSDWIQLTLGGVHNADGFACALKVNRTLWCWGENGWGATGQATLVGDTLVPTQVGLSNQWGSVDAGEYHVCAVALDTHVWCWGTNQYGVTALGTGLGSATVPTMTTLTAGWANVSAGGVHTCGVRTSGVMNCWGWGSTSQAPPSPPGTTWVIAETAPEVTAATTYSCAINSAGALYCFGYNDFGRTGLNTNTGITNPPAELTTVANGEAYSTPTLIRSAGQPNLTFLVRVRMPDDGTTDGRQNATGGESIVLTHRFTSSPVTAGAV